MHEDRKSAAGAAGNGGFVFSAAAAMVQRIKNNKEVGK